MSWTGHIGDGNAAVCQVLRSYLVEAVMHHRHEFVLHSLQHVEPMKVDIISFINISLSHQTSNNVFD